MGDHVLFFYGTLMAPQMLHRVIYGRADPEPWQKALLSFQPAVLHGYRRHRVRGADYPGIVPASGSTQFTEKVGAEPDDQIEANHSARTSVLGTLVSGLTDGDVHRLDIYEGNEYAHGKVKVRTLKETLHQDQSHERGNSNSGGNLRDVLDAAGAEFTDEQEEVDAVTYVWTAGVERLESAEWDFETFKRDKMAWWVEKDESQW
ncbi:disease resistance protein Aig2 [Penicillium verhagenii]|nr:disease resistance protein Aig2 [Penicillium verhagenii]